MTLDWYGIHHDQITVQMLKLTQNAVISALNKKIIIVLGKNVFYLSIKSIQFIYNQYTITIVLKLISKESPKNTRD